MSTSASATDRIKVWFTTKTGLIVRKAIIAFLVGFGGVLIPATLQILDLLQKAGEPTVTSALLVSVVAGAFAAGIRTALAVIPGLNLGPTDSLTSIGTPTTSVTVTTADKP